MRLPDRSSIETRQCFLSAGHVRETSEPDEAIGIIEIAELTDDAHPGGLLRLDKLGVEEIDEGITLARMECVLAELDDHDALSKSMIQFVSHVLPPSSEKACSHRATFSDSFDQRKRT